MVSRLIEMKILIVREAGREGEDKVDREREKQREKERDIERNRETERERKKERKKERERERERERLIERERETQRGRERHREGESRRKIFRQKVFDLSYRSIIDDSSCYGQECPNNLCPKVCLRYFCLTLNRMCNAAENEMSVSNIQMGKEDYSFLEMVSVVHHRRGRRRRRR